LRAFSERSVAISAIEVAFTNRVDLVALVTGDADFVPLVWAIKRRGIRVAVLGFEFGEGPPHKASSTIAPTLKNAANFAIDVSALARTDAASFAKLFKGRPGNPTSVESCCSER
jgi:uncharacterized protein (TIGR00288 family)